MTLTEVSYVRGKSLNENCSRKLNISKIHLV